MHDSFNERFFLFSDGCAELRDRPLIGFTLSRVRPRLFLIFPSPTDGHVRTDAGLFSHPNQLICGLRVGRYICVCAAVQTYSINRHGGAMVVFHKLCRTAWSLREQRTESVSVMGHTRSAAECSTVSDKKQRTSLYISRRSGASLLQDLDGLVRWLSKV